MKSYMKIFLMTCTLATVISCEDQLEEEVFSQLAPETLFTTEEGLREVLFSSYAYGHISGVTESWSYYFLNEMPAGETWGAGGSIETFWTTLIDFTWDSNHVQIGPVWNSFYASIRDANIVLDNLDNENFSEEFRTSAEAEARFLRAWSYSQLYDLFGRLPLYTSSTDDPLQPRATEEETKNFIEQELLAVIPELPVEPAAFGRASKGAAMGILAKYYLNTRQWQKAADMAEAVMDLGKYRLLDNYSDVFAIENEGNDELVWALPKNGASITAAQSLNALIFPPDYPVPYPNNTTFASRVYMFDEFVTSFEENDVRANHIITSYVSRNTGEVVQGLGNDRSFPYKTPWDPNSNTFYYGNDIPVIRYSDILLTRAEALNELTGPTQEVIDLINEVKTRAGASLLQLADYDQSSLRDAILQERHWEFFFEAKARQDQIRHGVFIPWAQERGTNAQDHHRLFPIPQVELDANNLLEQNPGY